MSQAFSNNINSLNTTVNNLTVTDDRSNILTWLSPLDPKLRHHDIRDRRVEDVGEWVLKTEEFRNWYASGEGESDNAVLFCYGDPGVGKTFISSLVVDRLCDQLGGQEVAVACFYFDFAAQKEQSLTSMLGALLKQVVSGLEEIPEEIARAYKGHKKVIDGLGLQLTEIIKMLQTTTSGKPTFICIDALDECVERYRVKILNSLNQILQGSPGTRVFVTGRAHTQAEVGSRLSGRVTTLHITPRRDDIISYLHRRLDEDTTPDAMNSSLQADILKKIPEDISETFVLVSLNIDAILRETTIRRRRQKLNAMTDGLGLGGAYAETLSRIEGQGEEKSRLGMAALMWISHSERPMKVDELCHALGVEMESPDLDGDNVPSIGTLLACCQGLVVVDKEASTVRLSHFTLQEYLRAHPELFSGAHSTIAETCLSYLNSNQVKALSASPYRGLGDSSAYRGFPFLEYSALYWGIHAKRDLSDCAKQLALKLFDNCSNHISIKILFDAQKSRFFTVDFDQPSLFTSLHFASFFGIVEIVAGLVGVEGCDTNQRDCTGSTPLAWAAVNGHEGVVKLLLEQDDVSPDKPDIDGRTPLWYASWHGHVGVVKMLLQRDDVDPDKPDIGDRTPLRCAARNGHEKVVKILLGQDDVNPDKLDLDRRTPLWYAVWNGHMGVVEMLLERDDVSPDKPDTDGQTPLLCAAEKGQGGMVEILLRREGVDPEKLNAHSQTPLWCAARCGHERVVKILLERDDVNPDKPDKNSITPLSGAAESGYEGVVKKLLGRGDVNPNKHDNDGRTPLWCAAENGHEGVVKTLLGQDDVNPDEPASNGVTPLSCAAWSGYEGVVKILLGRGGIDPNKPDNDGRTALWCAAVKGREGVVKILLGRDDVNPNKQDGCGRTPLWCAAENGGEGVVKILLGRDDVNPDKPDNDGRTPLFYAAWHGHAGVVKSLLERGDVNPNKPDNDGRTPLWCAAVNGHEGVVKILLGRDDINPNQLDGRGRTPLWWATRRGHAGVVALLQPPESATPGTA